MKFRAVQRAACLLVLAGVLGAGTAHAAPLSGLLMLQGEAMFPPSSEVEAASPLVVLRNHSTNASLEFTAETLEGELLAVYYLATRDVGNVYVTQKTGEEREPVSFRNARVEAVPETDSFLAAYPEDGDRFRFSLRNGTALQTEPEGPREVFSKEATARNPGGRQSFEFYYQYARPHQAITTRDGAVLLQGDFHLYLWDATVWVTSPDGSKSYRTGETKADDNGLTHNLTRAALFLSAKNATLRLSGGNELLALAETLEATAIGTVVLTEASGQFQAGDSVYRASGDRVSLEGTFTLSQSPPGQPQEGESAALLANARPAARIEVQGELTATNLHGKANPPVPAESHSVPLWLGLSILVGTVVAVASGVFAYRSRAANQVGNVEVVSHAGDVEWGGPFGERHEVLRLQAYRWMVRDIFLISPLMALYYHWRLAMSTVGTPSPGILHDRAVVHFKVGFVRRAIKELVVVTEAQPWNESAWVDLARAYSRRGDMERGAHALRTAVRILPELMQTSAGEPTLRRLLDHIQR